MSNRYPCLYSVIRFLPYRETEEFANAGILIFCEKLGYLAYRLETSRHARFTDFFLGLEAKIYTEGVKNLNVELKSILPEIPSDLPGVLSGTSGDLKRIFSHLVRPRRTLFHFSEPRVLLAKSPQDSLEELFDYYVEKLFAQHPEYQETIMKRTVGHILSEIDVKSNYRDENIGDDSYHMSVPFFHRGDQGSKAIKPISFVLSDSTKIWTKGYSLIGGFDRLQKRKLLPSRFLLPIKHPEADGKKEEASRELCRELVKAGIEVVNVEDREKIKKFARIDKP